ncbi:MAG: competence/damage-inducible protein A, partial [Thermoguttaceae bacterium]|nr:competence/damage-inducible protein A [Thermoguttaceae bacterium]
MSGESLHAEIISIGDELTIGKIVDTNSAWLSQKLTDLGVDVLWHSTVGDSMEALVSVLKIACARAEIVLVTGGLGPTEDDLTRQAI